MDSEIIKKSINNFQSGFPVIVEKVSGIMVYPTPDTVGYDKIIDILKNLIVTRDKTIFYYESEEQYFKKECYSVDDEYVKFEFLDVTSIYKKYISALETVETLQIDFTTKLPVKRKLYDDIVDYLLYAINSSETFGLLMIDIDNFKKVNDTFGHEYGDKVLRDLSAIGKNSIRQDLFRSKDIIGRFGGEEIVVLLKNLKSDEMEMIGERIRHNIEIEKAEMPITVSLGCVHSDDILKTLDLRDFQIKIDRIKLNKKVNDMIELADKALYYSKQHGKNQLTNYAKIKESLSLEEANSSLSNDDTIGSR